MPDDAATSPLPTPHRLEGNPTQHHILNLCPGTGRAKPKRTQRARPTSFTTANRKHTMSYCRACGHQIHETALRLPAMRAVQAPGHHAQSSAIQPQARYPIFRHPLLPSPPGLQRHPAAGAVRPQRLGSGPVTGLLPVHHHRNRARQHQPGQTNARQRHGHRCPGDGRHCPAWHLRHPALKAPTALRPQPISTLRSPWIKPQKPPPSQMTFCHGCSKPYTSPLSPAPMRRTTTHKAGHHHPTHSCRQKKQSHRWHPGPAAGRHRHPQVLPGAWGWGIIYIVLCLTYIPALVALVEGIRYLTLKQPEFAQRPRAWTGRLPSCGDKPTPTKTAHRT